MELDTASVALIFAMGCNLYALVWGASKLSSKVSELSRVLSRLDNTVTIVNNRSVSNERSIAVLKTVVGIEDNA